MPSGASPSTRLWVRRPCTPSVRGWPPPVALVAAASPAVIAIVAITIRVAAVPFASSVSIAAPSSPPLLTCTFFIDLVTLIAIPSTSLTASASSTASPRCPHRLVVVVSSSSSMPLLLALPITSCSFPPLPSPCCTCRCSSSRYHRQSSESARRHRRRRRLPSLCLHRRRHCFLRVAASTTAAAFSLPLSSPPPYLCPRCCRLHHCLSLLHGRLPFPLIATAATAFRCVIIIASILVLSPPPPPPRRAIARPSPPHA